MFTLFLATLSLCYFVWAFSSCGERWLFSSCSVQASHRGGFSCDARALGCQGFSSCSAQLRALSEAIILTTVFSSVQLLSRVLFFVTPRTAACQASLSITSSQSLLRLMSIESVMPSNHLILCPPLLLLPSIFPSIRVFSKESVICIRWPKYWSFSFSISPFQ